MEILLVGIVVLFIITYRFSAGQGVYKFVAEKAHDVYSIYEPYSYKEMRKKIKSLGMDYTPRQYLTQFVVFAGFAGVIGYMYFYSLFVALVYAIVAVAAIPYVTYLRTKRQYSEFVFEQVQVYVTNTIMEFATTQAFEGGHESRKGYAPQELARQTDGEEAQNFQGRRAQSRSAAAPTVRNRKEVISYGSQNFIQKESSVLGHRAP